MLRAISGVSLMLLVAGCATFPIAHKPQPITQVKIVKHPDPCPCSQTANQVVKKRWFSGFKVKLFH